MAKPPKALVSKQRTIHMYSELWHASQCVLDAGIHQPSGSSSQFLSSAVLTAFAFEAYVNHVGPTVISCWKQLERLPPLSKFDLLCETLGVSFPEGLGRRPLQSVIKLLEFRNTMAHGRSRDIKAGPELRDANDKLDQYLGQRPLAKWERLIQNADFARQVRDDLKEVLTLLHAARPEPKEGLFVFGIATGSACVAAEPHL
jgi:hypothetical protein